MRIGIDCRSILNPYAGEQAGVGHYTYYLVRALLEYDQLNEYYLYFDKRLPEHAARSFIARRAHNVAVKFFPFSDYSKRVPFVESHILIARMLEEDHLDVCHFPGHNLPLGYKRPSVMTVHDVAIYKNASWFPRQYISQKILFPRMMEKATKIIAVSQSTARDIEDIFAQSAHKVSVVPEGCELHRERLFDHDVLHHEDVIGLDDLHALYGISKPYMLFLGTLEPRKNIAALCEAFVDYVCESGIDDLELVIAGAPGYGGQKIRARVQAENMRAYKARGIAPVRIVGYVAHAYKIALMEHAQAFLFPSLYEGFGLPVLEALTLGVPVLTSDTSSLPEITGPDAAVLVNPLNTADIRHGIARLHEDSALRTHYAHQGVLRSKQFTWDAVARATQVVYERATIG